jgi:hypothetical protein
MYYGIITLIAFIGIIIAYIVGYYTAKDKYNTFQNRLENLAKDTIINKYDNCDIVQLENSMYAPKYGKDYCFICAGGSPNLHSTISNFNMFTRYEEAKQYLDRWLIYKGTIVKSIGIK